MQHFSQLLMFAKYRHHIVTIFCEPHENAATSGLEVIMKPASLYRAILTCCVLTSGSIFAQRTTATLYGNVQDATGAVIPQAQIRLTDEQTAGLYSAQSDQRGDFTLTFLPAGRYRVDV